MFIEPLRFFCLLLYFTFWTKTTNDTVQTSPVVQTNPWAKVPDAKPVSIVDSTKPNESSGDQTYSPSAPQQQPTKSTPPTKTITSSMTSPNLSTYNQSLPSNLSSKPMAPYNIPVTNLDTNDWPSLNDELGSFTSLNISNSSTSKVSSLSYTVT